MDSVDATPQSGAKPDAIEDFNALLALAGTHAETAEQLLANLERIYQIASQADLNSYDFTVIRRAAPDLLRGTGHLRLAVRDQIPDWQKRGLMTPQVQEALRDVFRITRYAADMLGELTLDHQRLAPGEAPHPGFTGPASSLIFHGNTGPSPRVDFRAGDVIMVRGLFHNSAAISRGGDFDAQFSHICIVHADATGKKWVVESLIEEGALIKSLDDALAHGIGRAILLRHHDAGLARRAAELIHARVARSRTSRLCHIPYDFSMRLTGYRSLFCSKLVRQAFEMASKGRITLPTYKTTFYGASTEFLERIGVTAKETFAPADMELESDFEMVAEWADHRVTSDLRLQDMVLTEMFAWMRKDRWHFQEDNTIRLIGWFGRFAAHLSDDI